MMLREMAEKAIVSACSGCAGKLSQIARSDIYKCRSCGREHRRIGNDIRDTFKRGKGHIGIPLTLREIAEMAVHEKRPSFALRVLHMMKRRGFDSRATYEAVNRWTGVSLATWNEMLRCADKGYDDD